MAMVGPSHFPCCHLLFPWRRDEAEAATEINKEEMARWRPIRGRVRAAKGGEVGRGAPDRPSW